MVTRVFEHAGFSARAIGRVVVAVGLPLAMLLSATVAVADVDVTDAGDGNLIVSGTFYDGTDLFQLVTMSDPNPSPHTEVFLVYDDAGSGQSGICLTTDPGVIETLIQTRDTDHLSVAVSPVVIFGLRACLSAVTTTGAGPIPAQPSLPQS